MAMSHSGQIVKRLRSAPGKSTIHCILLRGSTNLSRCYYALLATPNNYGIVWLLAQHKASMGMKVLTSVTIWGGEDNTDQRLYTSNPTLIWQVMDITNDVAQIKAGSEFFWMNLPAGSDYKEYDVPSRALA